jgi:hypothetical protein
VTATEERTGPSIVARAAISAGLALVGGATVGLAVRIAASDALAEERGSAAAVCAFALAVCLAPCAARGGRVERLLCAAASGALAAVAAVLASGGVGLVGAAVVTAGASSLALGVSLVAARWDPLARGAGLVGALVPFALAALVFVADPWIEARGSGPESPARASLVYRLSPIAALTSLDGGTGVDWQTRSLLYDGGPEGGAGGFSVIGQYYPSRPSSPLVWGGLAALAGVLLTGVGSSRRTTPDTL